MQKKFFGTVYMYGWFLKGVGAALLIALALFLYFGDAGYLIEAFIGIIILGYALVRLVPYVRSQKSDLIKTINIIEITLNILVAAILIVSAFAAEGTGVFFSYLFGGVLLVRGGVHFYSISYGAEKGDHLSFFFHIATLIIGTLVVYRGTTIEDIVILLMILALLSGGYLGFETYSGYNRFRRHKQMESSKEDTTQDEVPKGIDAPGKRDEPEDRDRDRPVA